MVITKDDIIKALEKMKLAELNELVKAIEDHFGIVAGATVVATQSERETTTTPSEVDVILTKIGQSKVAVIKLVSQITGKGLMDAKLLVEKLPAIIKTKVKQEEAEELKGQLIVAGASVDLK